ncbi:hypothetical protein F5X99DRAFT_424744 [Biscogniauxia marginata]|nr:hypothetical protein F5X99DRAFT_424744 [Biscogniauxia marginata]
MASNTEEDLLLPRTNVLEVRPGKRISYPSRWQSKSFDKGLPSDWRTDRRITRSMNALQVLQVTRDQHLLPECISVPVDFIFESLPKMVKLDVNIMKPGKAMFDMFTCNDFDFSCLINDEFMVDIDSNGDYVVPPLYRQFRRKPYHFWAVDVSTGQNPQWQLIILHLQRTKKTDDDYVVEDEESDDGEFNKYFDKIESIAVIDPEYGRAGEARKTRTLDRILQVLDALDIKPVNPPQYDTTEHWSSGLRVFEIIRASLNRITESYCRNPRVHDGGYLWRSHSGWFNPDAVRSDMIGMAATVVNRAMDSTTRVVIEPIKDMRYKSGKKVEIQNMMPDRTRVNAFRPNARKPSKPPVQYAEDVSSGSEPESESDFETDSDNASSGESLSGEEEDVEVISKGEKNDKEDEDDDSEGVSEGVSEDYSEGNSDDDSEDQYEDEDEEADVEAEEDVEAEKGVSNEKGQESIEVFAQDGTATEDEASSSSSSSPSSSSSSSSSDEADELPPRKRRRMSSKRE